MRDEPQAPPGRRGGKPRDQDPPGRPQPVAEIQVGGEDPQGIDAGRGRVPGDFGGRGQRTAGRREAEERAAA